MVVAGSGLDVGMDDNELDDGLKWRGRISDNDEDSEDEFGLYAERLNRPYEDLADDRDEDDEDDDGDEDDEDDPLGGLVTIGNLHADEADEDDEADGDGDGDGGAGRQSEPEDFLKQLEELIERDMPKVKITDEYQKVLDAVDASDGGLVGDVGAARKDSVVMVDAEGGEAAAPGDTAMRMRDGDDGDDGDNDDDGDDGDDGDDDAVPDLGSVLGGKQVDREAETLAELVEGLVVDEEAERERQRRGKFFDDDDANE